MNEKDFENKSTQNDVKFLRSQLGDIISKGEKVRQDWENITRTERELKLRIHAAENGW